MARYVDVNLSGFCVQVELETKQVRFFDPSNWMTSPQWWAKDVRNISKRMSETFPGFRAMGAYRETPGISIELFNPDGTRFAYLGLDRGTGGGTAYGPKRAPNTFSESGRWNPTDKPIPHTWYGLMVKGSAGVALGAEGQIAALLSSMDKTHGCTIGAKSGRGGPVGGASIGLGVVFATGFKSPTEFSSYRAEGLDWALSFGTKFEALVKGASKLSALARVANGILERLEDAARIRALKDTMLQPEVGAEVYGIGKSLIAGSLIDTDLQSITVVDIPLASLGAEVGIYYAKTAYSCLSEW